MPTEEQTAAYWAANDVVKAAKNDLDAISHQIVCEATYHVKYDQNVSSFDRLKAFVAQREVAVEKYEKAWTECDKAWNAAYGHLMKETSNG